MLKTIEEISSRRFSKASSRSLLARGMGRKDDNLLGNIVTGFIWGRKRERERERNG